MSNNYIKKQNLSGFKRVDQAYWKRSTQLQRISRIAPRARFIKPTAFPTSNVCQKLNEILRNAAAADDENVIRECLEAMDTKWKRLKVPKSSMRAVLNHRSVRGDTLLMEAASRRRPDRFCFLM